MALVPSDERLVLAYFAAEELHIERWRQVGGQWEPFAGVVPVAGLDYWRRCTRRMVSA